MIAHDTVFFIFAQSIGEFLLSCLVETRAFYWHVFGMKK